MSKERGRLLNYVFYYVVIITPLAFFLSLFYYFYTPVTNNSSLTQSIMFLARMFWLTSTLVAITNLVGLILYGPQDKYNDKAIRLFKRKNGWSIKKQLIVVYVSRGDNAGALVRSVLHTEALLKQCKVKYRIEVVTDMPIDKNGISYSKNVRFNVVPTEYGTRKKAKYKARALEYLLRTRLSKYDKNNNWILHLDEESILHFSAVAGIREFIAQRKNCSTIGQGEIKYNAFNYGANPLITSIDAVRTGDDLGRFRLQFKLFKKPLFGMHGSFILVPLKVEQDIGFDLGGKGSITEDAYFALLASAKYSFGWVDGYIQEQSPFSISAIIQQRRRWFNGLALLSFDEVVPLKTRLPLMIAMTLWAIAWISPFVALINFAFGGYFPIELLVAAVFTQGSFASVYTVGAFRNLQDLHWSILRKTIYLIIPMILMPVATVIEGVAVVYGLIKPVKTFDVVNKNQPNKKLLDFTQLVISAKARLSFHNSLGEKALELVESHKVR